MVLLPDSLDIDPGLRDFQNDQVQSQLPNAEGIRLWAKNFATCGQSEGIEVPNAWRDFVTFNLLNHANFEWINSLLKSGAWKLTISDKNAENPSPLQFLVGAHPSRLWLVLALKWMKIWVKIPLWKLQIGFLPLRPRL
jgi:hypothetical protein